MKKTRYENFNIYVHTNFFFFFETSHKLLLLKVFISATVPFSTLLMFLVSPNSRLRLQLEREQMDFQG